MASVCMNNGHAMAIKIIVAHKLGVAVDNLEMAKRVLEEPTFVPNRVQMWLFAVDAYDAGLGVLKGGLTDKANALSKDLIEQYNIIENTE